MNMQIKGQRVFRVFLSYFYSLSTAVKKGLASTDPQSNQTLKANSRRWGEIKEDGFGVGGGK